MQKARRKGMLAALLCFALWCAGVAHAQGPVPTPTPLPGGADEKKPGQAEAPAEETRRESDLYDPSIFILEGSGAWRHEVAPGYAVDYACEWYLDRSDPNDNRSADGLYTGAMWLSTKLSIADYLKDMLKNMPIDMGFAAGGEGICDNFTVHVLARHQREPWQDYGIPGEGEELLPPEGALVAQGSLILVAGEAYLSLFAEGLMGGERLEHADDRASDAEIFYTLHIAPDPGNRAEERKATLHLYAADGMQAVIEGTWRRIPGYPEDVLAYAESGKGREMLDRHLEGGL